MWYWIIPPACLILALGPGFLRRWLATRHARQGGIAYAEYQRLRVPLIRIETGLAALVMTALCMYVGWRTVLLFYGLGPILWSSTQYLEHAYAPRDVIHGAFNLRANRWWSAINLFRELDLTHHRHTRIPWCYLPRLTPLDPAQPSLLRHYLRTWRGPVRGVGPGP